jgi:hypothetical protein
MSYPRIEVLKIKSKNYVVTPSQMIAQIDKKLISDE